MISAHRMNREKRKQRLFVDKIQVFPFSLKMLVIEILVITMHGEIKYNLLVLNIFVCSNLNRN